MQSTNIWRKIYLIKFKLSYWYCIYDGFELYCVTLTLQEMSFSIDSRSFETQMTRMEADFVQREAPPSYGQLIAQGLIPPVDDFPVYNPSQVVPVHRFNLLCLAPGLLLTTL